MASEFEKGVVAGTLTTIGLAVAVFTAVPLSTSDEEKKFEKFKTLSVEEQQTLCITDKECEWAWGIPYGEEGSLPRLVGLGCDGTTSPIYAYEEDDFPRCEAIRPIHFGD